MINDEGIFTCLNKYITTLHMICDMVNIGYFHFEQNIILMQVFKG